MAEGSKPEGILLGGAEATPGQSAELRILGAPSEPEEVFRPCLPQSVMAAVKAGLEQVWPFIKRKLCGGDGGGRNMQRI